MNTELQHRLGTVESVRADGVEHRVELSVSSELPVERGTAFEILDHSPGNVDLTRFQAGAPFLENHNPDSQIGIIERAWLADRKLRVIVRFSRNQRAQEVFNDFRDGIKRNVSIGYRLLRELGEEVLEGGRRAIRYAFAPYEASAVSVPADFTVGLGRSYKITESNMNINDNQTTDAVEIAAIKKLLSDKVPGVEPLADQAILRGWSVKEFRAEALKLMPSVEPMQRIEPEFSQKETRGYNLGKAILEFAEGGRLSGLEAELNTEIISRTGVRPHSFFAPADALKYNTRAAGILGTATLGGYLVATETGNWIDILRANMIFGQLGVSVMGGLNGKVAFPRLSSGSAVSWPAETATVTATEIQYEQVLLSPKCAAAGVEYSKMLLQTSNVHDVIIADLGRAIGNAIDAGIAHGSGTAEFTGLQIATGVNAVTIAADGGAPSMQVVLDLEEAVATANGVAGRGGYATNPKVRSVLKRTAIIADIAGPVWSLQRSPDGFETLNGYKAAVSSAIASNLTAGTNTAVCSAAFFSSDWSQAVLGLWGALDLTIDPVTLAANRVVKVWAHQLCDFQLKQPACFARILELTT